VPHAHPLVVTQVTHDANDTTQLPVVHLPVLTPGGGVTLTLVDPADADRLAHRSWWLHPDGYAASDITSGTGKVIAYLHREILAPPPGLVVDHINGNRLDNRRANLRVATPSENNANSRDRPRRSGYRGVYWHRQAERWVSQISVNGRLRHLGLFDDPEEAAKAYDVAARAAWGPYARTNGFA
jgi:hypothetical protein